MTDIHYYDAVRRANEAANRSIVTLRELLSETTVREIVEERSRAMFDPQTRRGKTENERGE